MYQSACSRNGLAGHSKHEESTTNALRIAGIKWDDEIRLWRHFQYSVGLIFKANRNNVSFGKYFQQARHQAPAGPQAA